MLFLVFMPAKAFWGNEAKLFASSFHVKKLNDQDFHKMVETNKDQVWIVDFYAPWCPHCQQFAPEWEQVAEHYASSPKVFVGAVDCTIEANRINKISLFGKISWK